MLITKSAFSHIGQLDGSFGAGIHEPITTLGVKFCSGYYFCQFLHIGRLDIDNVEALVLDVEIPQIDAEIVTADKGLSIAVDRDAVDVISMRICICSPRHSGYNCIVVGHSRKFEFRGMFESIC